MILDTIDLICTKTVWHTTGPMYYFSAYDREEQDDEFTEVGYLGGNYDRFRLGLVYEFSYRGTPDSLKFIREREDKDWMDATSMEEIMNMRKSLYLEIDARMNKNQM